MISPDLTLRVLKARPLSTIPCAPKSEEHGGDGTHHDVSIQKVLASIAKADDRVALERSIGRPLFAIDPKPFSRTTYGREPYGPDWIECYVFGGWAINIWFFGGQVESILASTTRVMP